MKFNCLLVPLALICVTASAQQSGETAPASVGIVLDTSGSMGSKLGRFRQIVAAVLNSANPLDEFAIIKTSDRPVAMTGFVSAASAMETTTFIQAKGRTALLDGIYLGAQLMKMAHNQRKVIIVVSDGDDNASRYTFSEVGTALSETGVQVYTVALNDSTEAPDLLRRLADRGRGLYFGIPDVSHLPQTVSELSAAIRAER